MLKSEFKNCSTKKLKIQRINFSFYLHTYIKLRHIYIYFATSSEIIISCFFFLGCRG